MRDSASEGRPLYPRKLVASVFLGAGPVASYHGFILGEQARKRKVWVHDDSLPWCVGVVRHARTFYAGSFIGRTMPSIIASNAQS